MADAFPHLPDRPVKRGRTEAPFHFELRTNYDNFPRFHVLHSEGTSSMRKLSPFLVAKSLGEAIGKEYKASKMSSGDLLIELKKKEQIQKLYDLVSIGNTDITITAHRSLNTCRGVISEEDFLNLSDEELLEGFQNQNVIKVQRITMRRNNEQLPTKHIILTFGTSTLPSSLDAGYLKINVRPYIPNPRRCFKCQRFGHASQSCRGKEACAKCSANGHSAEKCQESPCCVNCKGDHPAYSRSCPVWKREKDVIALTVKEKISFFDARKRLGVLPQRSFASVVRQGAAPQQLQEHAAVTTRGPVAAPPAPVEVAASAAPSSSKASPQTLSAQGPRLNRTPRPETRVSGPSPRSSSASEKAMEVDGKTMASSTPKDQRSSERTKKEKIILNTQKKGPVT